METMNLGMYKPGQGYWTRVFTAVGIAALVAGGTYWVTHQVIPGEHVHALFGAGKEDIEAGLKATLGRVPTTTELDAQVKVRAAQFAASASSVARILMVLIPLLAAAGGWLLLNTPRVVEFMIATEAEMKKVVWPTRQTLIAMTWVVIGALAGLAGLVAGIDLAFTSLFKLIHIL